MLKILLIGNSPLPNENVKVRPAAGLRTWQFMRGLASGVDRASGFEIKSVVIAMPECYDGDIQENVQNDDFLIFENQDQNGFFEPKNEMKSLYVQTSTSEVGQFGKNSGEAKSVHVHTQISENGRTVKNDVKAAESVGVRRFGGGGRQPLVADEQGGCFAEQLSKDDPNLLKKLQKIHDEFKPEVIVAVNTYPSFIASRLNSAAIFWADLNGWIMAEAQAQAHKMGSNDYLLHYTEMEESILRRADKFSTVSEAQKFAVLGELASIGRLCAESFGYEFCHVVQNGTEWFEGESNLQNGYVQTFKSHIVQSGKNSEESKSLYGHTYTGDGRGSGTIASNGELAGMVDDLFKSVPGNAFVLLWMGGYNTWVDETTLFKAVESAMQSCENLYFVSTGGEISGLDNKTFANFKLLIDGSAFKDRFVFLGWVDTKLIPYIYGRADVGLNVDKLCVETLTGARNRINEMMKFGLPVITTLGSEISYEVIRVGAGIGVVSCREDLLSEAIVKMWKEAGGSSGVGGGGRGGGSGDNVGGGSFVSYGKNGQEYIEKFCNYEVTLKPLLKWLERPVAAPDKGVVTSRDGFLPIGALRGGLKYLRENGVGKFSKKLWQKIKIG